MWQAPDLKRRALIEAQREARERRKRENSFKFRRSRAQVRISGLEAGPTVVKARVILNEITFKGMGLFSGEDLPVGQLAGITIEEPTRMYLRARIVSSKEISGEGRVISTEPFPYRVAVQFLFESEEEVNAFRAFCEELEEKLLAAKKN